MGKNVRAETFCAHRKSRQNTLPRVLVGLGITLVACGRRLLLAEALEPRLPSLRLDVEKLQEAEEVGPKVAESIQEFFGDSHNRDWASGLPRRAQSGTIERKQEGGII